ncbi:MAG: SigB/SigF/SigG family RNA polymerase sigma factor [Gemmiger sp.]
MYSGKVEICGVNTAQLPILSERQKTELLTRARAGDKVARQKMIQGNLRLVLSVVQKFSGRGENLDDLFQVGCIGLIKAIDHFDPSLKVRFSTYGVPMIVGEIRRFLRDNAPVRVSRSIRDLAYHSMQAREELQKQTGREPRVSEIAARLGATPENVAMALESVVEPVSLYEPAYTDGDESVALMDRVPEAGGEESWVSSIMFKDTMRTLSQRERRIISLRYLSGKTQVQVAREIGISQAQVSRLEKNALCRIREQISCC